MRENNQLRPLGHPAPWTMYVGTTGGWRDGYDDPSKAVLEDVPMMRTKVQFQKWQHPITLPHGILVTVQDNLLHGSAQQAQWLEGKAVC